MPNIQSVNGVSATSLDKVNRVSASSIQSIDGQDLVTFSPSIHSTVNGNLSAGTWTIPAGATHISIFASGAGGGPANYANVNNSGNNHRQSGTGGGGGCWSGPVSTANFNTVNIAIGAGATATTGGTTTVNYGNTTMTANGGTAGHNNPGGNYISGGTASGGAVNIDGGQGGGSSGSSGRGGTGNGVHPAWYPLADGNNYNNHINHSRARGTGGGGGGGWGTGSNTNHYFAWGGGGTGYGQTASQVGATGSGQESVFNAYLFGGCGGGGGQGGWYNGGNRGIYTGSSNPGTHRYADSPNSGSFDGPIVGGGTPTNAPTDGNTKADVGHGHANNSSNTRKGGGGSGGGGAYGANYNQPVVNGTGSADLSNTTGGIPQAGCVIIYSYVG